MKQKNYGPQHPKLTIKRYEDGFIVSGDETFGYRTNVKALEEAFNGIVRPLLEASPDIAPMS